MKSKIGFLFGKSLPISVIIDETETEYISIITRNGSIITSSLSKDLKDSIEIYLASIYIFSKDELIKYSIKEENLLYNNPDFRSTFSEKTIKLFDSHAGSILLLSEDDTKNNTN